MSRLRAFSLLNASEESLYAQDPTRQKRPGDVISAAVKVAKIATQEIEDESNADKSCFGRTFAINGELEIWASRAVSQSARLE